MTSSRPTLTVLTPEPASPLPPKAFLDRCTELGLLAFQYRSPDGYLAPTRQPAALNAAMRSSTIAGLVRETLLKAAESGARLTEDVLLQGLRVAIFSHRAGPLPAGFTVVVFLCNEVFGDGLFQKVCAAAGLSTEQLRAEASPFIQAENAVQVTVRSLMGTALDIETIQEQTVALDGFTEQLTDSYDTMDLLYSVGRSMREPFKPEQFLNFVCGRLFAARSFRWIAIVFSGGKEVAAGLRNQLVTAGQLPCGQEQFRESCLSLITRTAFPQVLEKVSGISTDERPQVMAQPLICKGQPVGVLVAGGKYGDDPDISSYDIQIIEAAAGYINAFSDNVALYEDQHTLFMGTVQALTAAIDAKDRYTFGHSERVAQVASQLALAMGMSREQAERVRIAGLVHDVGKIGVPEAVLTKSGRLTEEEFAHIKKHPEIGFNILRDIHLLEDVLPGVLHHHERYDGRGYPHGLSGDKIPLIARLLAVADTFDAMSSTRSYRSAMPRDVVLAEIGRCSGTQFDPALAMAFVKLDLRSYDEMVARHAAGYISAAA